MIVIGLGYGLYYDDMFKKLTSDSKIYYIYYHVMENNIYLPVDYKLIRSDGKAIPYRIDNDIYGIINERYFLPTPQHKLSDRVIKLWQKVDANCCCCNINNKSTVCDYFKIYKSCFKCIKTFKTINHAYKFINDHKC